MKVLFIGGTGNISSASSKLAVEKGIDLYILNRGKRSEFFPAGAKSIQADIRNAQEVTDALKGHEFDTVVNWIAFTPADIERDITLFSGKTRQYIFISSASVYQKPVSHYIITELTPLINPYWDYSRNKISCEERLMQEYRTKGFPVTIVRPSLTYGDALIPFSTNSWNHPWTIVNRVRKGKKIIVHGDGTSLWTITHNTDFAKGLVGLLGKNQTIGNAFHITSDEVLTWNQIAKAIGRAAGVEPEIIHIPSEFIAAFAPWMEGDLLGDKAASMVFDNSKIKCFVPEYSATTPFGQGVRRSVEWFEAHPEWCTIDEAWDQLLDRIIAVYEAALANA